MTRDDIAVTTPATNRQVFNPTHLVFPGMSQAVLAGDLLAVSGQVALGDDGSLVGDGDPAAQVEQCFENLRAVLASAGMTMRDVVKYTCYLTSAAYYESFTAVKNRHFEDSPPASTTVIVSNLLDPRMLVELEALALRPRM